MKPEDHMSLMMRMKPLRKEKTIVNGVAVPSSVAVVSLMLANENDPAERRDIFHHLIFECRITDCLQLELTNARAEHEEFHDINSAITYSAALINNGLFSDGIAMSKQALTEAVERRELINYAAESYVRHAIRTKSVVSINYAVDALLLSMKTARSEDLDLELEWLSQAKALGANVEMIEFLNSTKSISTK